MALIEDDAGRRKIALAILDRTALIAELVITVIESDMAFRRNHNLSEVFPT